MTYSNKEINRLTPTNEDTVGPYYPPSLCENNNSLDMTNIRSGIVFKPLGEKITIKGCVKDIDGKLSNGCLLEFWQPNSQGFYYRPDTESHEMVDPWFTGYTRHRTKDGNFSLTTIKPGVADGRAPNITVTLFSDGIMRLVTQLFFADEKSNSDDPLLLSIPEELRERLMINKVAHNEYEIEIIMAGNNETPFFDDLLS